MMNNHNPAGAPCAVIDAASNRGSSGDEEDTSIPHQVIRQTSSRKRRRRDFPWSYTRDWQDPDHLRVRGRRQCTLCKKWFSPTTNAQGWKVHLKYQHEVNDVPSALQAGEEATLTSQQSLQVQQSMKKRAFAPHVVRAFENSIVDFVIGGDISLRASGEQRFQELVIRLTNGYTPPSTRTILRRTIELFSVAQPLLGKFLCGLNVAVSLTMEDGWSNRNMKGFYVVTAHWIDTATLRMKTLLLTILDVSSGTGVGNHVGSAL